MYSRSLALFLKAIHIYIFIVNYLASIMGNLDAVSFNLFDQEVMFL